MFPPDTDQLGDAHAGHPPPRRIADYRRGLSGRLYENILQHARYSCDVRAYPTMSAGIFGNPRQQRRLPRSSRAQDERGQFRSPSLPFERPCHRAEHSVAPRHVERNLTERGSKGVLVRFLHC